MKRKVLALTLSAVMVSSMLAGCSSGGVAQGPINQKDQTQQTVAGGDTGSDTDANAAEDGSGAASGEPSDTEVADNTEGLPEENPDTGERFILRNGANNTFFIVDKEGVKKEEYRIDDIFASDDIFEEYIGIEIVEYLDGDLIFKASGYDENNYYHSDVIAYNPGTGKALLVYGGLYDEYYSGIDVYDGKLYITNNDYNSDSGLIRFREKVFSKTPGKTEYEQGTVEITDLLEANTGLYFKLNQDNGYGYYFTECLTRQMNEYGFLTATQDGFLYMLYADGTIKNRKINEGTYLGLECYNADYIIYTGPEDGEEGDSSYSRFGYDISNDTVIPLNEYVGDVILDLSGNYLYSFKDFSQEAGVQNNHIFRYDLTTGKTDLLYETRNVPGAGYYTAGVESFTLIGDQIYFVDVMDRMLKWVRVNYDESGASYTDIYCDLNEIDTLKYGDVDYIQYTEECPLCGQNLGSTYKEYFRLSPEYSAFYEDINSDLYNEALIENRAEGEEMTEEMCKEHQENPEWYVDEYEENVTGVTVIGDRYLQVAMSGYYYAGGAHGMPYEQYFLYDLSTGKRKEFNDFYTGTDSDFANLMAEVVKRDYEAGAEYIEYTYDPDTLENIVNDVLSSTGPGSTIRYEENGIYVVYSPYVLGPFASGFIEIFVSYEELLGRDTL